MRPRQFFTDLPTIRTARLILRKVTLDDARDIFAYASNPQMTRFTTWDVHQSIEDAPKALDAPNRQGCPG